MQNETNLKTQDNLHSDYRDVICLSHLRWDFVYQRPQHLLSRFAKNGRRVFFFEEPVFTDEPTELKAVEKEENLLVLVPHIAHEDRENAAAIQREMLETVVETEELDDFIVWFYTPMAMDFAADFDGKAVVFDCMDELSAFKFAPPALVENEKRLLEKADLVFTGGQSLFEAKKDKHKNVHAFPSSIDVAHFAAAREPREEPADQRSIPHPKLGFCGVIDERMDLELLAGMADLRPDWQFVMIGPVVKISAEDLPRRANIHYLGGKDYRELPAYLSGWDIALMPFAINESTRFISPTKTPEYLAAGKPVISTPIRDVVDPYGTQGLVEIAATAEEFVAAAERIFARTDAAARQARADEFLAAMSWDETWSEMHRLIRETIGAREKSRTAQAA
ncbi:MAG: glycosyltransferase family 1 protein [Acidobacteria bacterium]|nr:glycosyltransferase family 1 protein [Acidobacteriota bacterium]